MRVQLYIFALVVGTIRCEFESFIVGGEMAAIEEFPFCASLHITCLDTNKTWMCGSSILNQDLILTAAHCLYNCKDQMKITISVGSILKSRGSITLAKEYIIHEGYDPSSMECDIALVKAKNRITFSDKTSRVALMRNPPMVKDAHLAGWGLIDEDENKHTSYLIKLNQTLWEKSDCEKIYGKLPPGQICAALNKDQYAAPGDSGGPLVIEGYIQVGLVSYKKHKIAKYLIVYTNVSYYYDWIVDNTQRLYCMQ